MEISNLGFDVSMPGRDERSGAIADEPQSVLTMTPLSPVTPASISVIEMKTSLSLQTRVHLSQLDTTNE